MAIVLRLTKGSQLTFAELDGNFSDLDSRVTTNTNSITTINASVSTLNTNLSGNDSDILSLQTDQNAIDTRLIAAEGELGNVAMTSTEADFGNRIVKFANTVDSSGLLPTASTVPGVVSKPKLLALMMLPVSSSVSVEFWINLPVVVSNLVIALSVADAGPTTSPVPPAVAFNVPPENVRFVPIVTLLNPPEPLP